MQITSIVTGTIETWLHLLSRPLKRAPEVRIEVPVSCYLVEHNGHKILFDAGQKPLTKAQSPLADYLVKVAPEEVASRQLAAMDIAPEQLDYIILSHGHEDHCAGVSDFPQVTLIASAAVADGVKHFGNKMLMIDGEYDVFGDGAIRCMPTPGHTPGHLSLMLAGDDAPTLLVGDAVYFPEALDHEPAAGEYDENPDFFDSIRQLRQWRDNGVKLIFGHTPFNIITEKKAF